jgi:hypothetical protein
MMRPILKGSTDQSVVIRIVDSTDGTPETGVVFNTSGIDLWYRREGATKTSITEATLSALNDAHSDGGILHIGDGYYRLDLPDAAVATGANGVMVGGTVTGMVVIGCYVPLYDVNPYDAVRMGMTAIPNVAQGNPGQLPTATAAGLVTLAGVTHTGAVIPTVSAVTGLTASNLDAAISTRATPAQVATELATYDAPTNAEMVARTLAAASYATAAAQATAQADLDILTGADGAIIASGTQTFNMTGNITGQRGREPRGFGGQRDRQRRRQRGRLGRFGDGECRGQCGGFRGFGDGRSHPHRSLQDRLSPLRHGRG